MNLSVVIVTMNRPKVLRRCLECLREQTIGLHQTIVVDASPNDESKEVVESFSEVEYLRNGMGYGHMSASRNMGVELATGDIIAFLDDDSFAEKDWHEVLVGAYGDEVVGAVGGRALNNQPGEATRGLDQIGKLLADGTLTGNFAADPGEVIEVDHMIGCNMSFRRKVLDEAGGFSDLFPGTEVREESHVCARIRKLGYKIVFNPGACVEHLGAPQVKGQRFNIRYDYYTQHNHLLFLVMNFGITAPITWRYIGKSLYHSWVHLGRKIVGESVRITVKHVGLITGVSVGLLYRIRGKG